MKSYTVKRQKKPIETCVSVPGSKSISNRALLLAALFPGEVILRGVSISDDAAVFIKALNALGFSVDENKNSIKILGKGGKIPKKSGEIYAGSAGTAARFLAALLGISDGEYILTASEQMSKRPMKPLFDALESIGAEIEYIKDEGHLPVRIKGAALCSKGVSGKGRQSVSLDISKSTQFLSALLMTGTILPAGLDIRITSEKKTGSYIGITLKMMEQFGMKALFDGEVYSVWPARFKECESLPESDACSGAGKETFEYKIEPDISGAMYFYAAAAITGGSALVRDVHLDCMQGDVKFLSVLRNMGCTISDEPEGVRVTGPAGMRPDAAGEEDGLFGITVDMNDFSDQALTLAAIAPYATSPVEIKNIAHIRGQESDRIAAIVTNLKSAGIRAEETADGVKIFPGTPHACEIETFKDHRVAMAFSVLGLRTDGIVIKDPDCSAKTFPGYFELFDSIYRGDL